MDKEKLKEYILLKKKDNLSEEEQSRLNELDKSFKENYSTKLSAEDEAKYQEWKKQIPERLQYEDDYDLKGYWNEIKDNEELLNEAIEAGKSKEDDYHLIDKYKKPTHESFSNESIYSKGDIIGGEWLDDKFVPQSWQTESYVSEMGNKPINAHMTNDNIPEGINIGNLKDKKMDEEAVETTQADIEKNKPTEGELEEMKKYISDREVPKNTDVYYPFDAEKVIEEMAKQPGSSSTDNALSEDFIKSLVDKMGGYLDRDKQNIIGHKLFSDAITAGEMLHNINEEGYSPVSVGEVHKIEPFKSIDPNPLMKSIDKSTAGALHQAREMGRPELADSILKTSNAQKMQAFMQVAAANAEREAQVKQANTQMLNQGIQLGMQTDQFNAQMKMQDEAMKGQHLSKNLTNLRASTMDATNQMIEHDDARMKLLMYEQMAKDPEFKKKYGDIMLQYAMAGRYPYRRHRQGVQVGEQQGDV